MHQAVASICDAIWVRTIHHKTPTELLCDSMVLDLIVETSQKNNNQEVELPSHQDFPSETGSHSKMAVGTSSGINSEDHECSAMDTVCATVGVFDSTSTVNNWSTLVD